MANLFPYLALAATKAATGALQGRQQADVVAEERRRRLIAEALQRQQADRQAHLDQIAAADRQRQQTIEDLQLAAPGAPVVVGAPPPQPEAGFLAPEPDPNRFVTGGGRYVDRTQSSINRSPTALAPRRSQAATGQRTLYTRAALTFLKQRNPDKYAALDETTMGAMDPGSSPTSSRASWRP
jgi:hypothetical protein